MNLKNNFILQLFLFISFTCFAQENDFQYKREIKNITGQWHKIILPDDIYTHLSPSLSNIRIWGITTKNDTLEAPYILKGETEKPKEIPVNFNLLNKSKANNSYFYTFHLNQKAIINNIDLSFNRNNFDWLINLEGSFDQEKWYQITENYRILSIKNNINDYSFTRIVFPTSQYAYYRLEVKSKEDPLLENAYLLDRNTTEPELKVYSTSTSEIKEENKETRLTIKLEQKLPVNAVFIQIKDTFDYYRPLVIQHITDTIKTEKGEKFVYKNIFSGTLSSLEENKFFFSRILSDNLIITIKNNNNIPLEIAKTEVAGAENYLLARFAREAKYFLVYGGKNKPAPQYDLSYFTERIPVDAPAVSLGEEQNIVATHAGVSPLFENKIWLWLILLFLIIVLGFFSLRMIRNA